MTVSTKLLPNNAGQVGATYKGAIDATTYVHDRIAGAFACHQNDQGSPDAPDMTVRVDAGALVRAGLVPLEVSAQSTGVFTAPSGNPRKDIVYIDNTTGAVGVATGAEAASPSDPAVPAGKTAVARVSLTVGMTKITNVDIDDLRVSFGGSSGGGSETVTAGEDISANDLIYQDVFNQRGAGASRWYKVDADAVLPVRISPRLGVALAAISSGNAGNAQVRPGRVAGFSGLTAGQQVWAHASTAGAVQQTAPSIPADGVQIATRIVGVAASATEIDFDPDPRTVFSKFSDNIAAGASVGIEHFKDDGAYERMPMAYLAAGGENLLSGGSNIGNFTNGGGLAAAFDGVTSQSQAASAQTSSWSSAGYIGKNWDSPKRVTRVVLFGPNNGGMHTNPGTSSFELQGSTDNFSASGDVLMTKSETTAHNTGVSFDYTTGITSTNSYQYHRIKTTCTSGDSAGYMAEVRFYETAAIRYEPMYPQSDSVNSSATNLVTCRYDDGGSPDESTTKTTFYNRTGATRDLIVEVTI